MAALKRKQGTGNREQRNDVASLCEEAPVDVERAGFVNIASHVGAMARMRPEQPAIVWTRRDGGYGRWTFRELNEEINRYSRGLLRVGVKRGTTTILMVRPSAELFALTFALFEI